MIKENNKMLFRQILDEIEMAGISLTSMIDNISVAILMFDVFKEEVDENLLEWWKGKAINAFNHLRNARTLIMMVKTSENVYRGES